MSMKQQEQETSSSCLAVYLCSCARILQCTCLVMYPGGCAGLWPEKMVPKGCASLG